MTLFLNVQCWTQEGRVAFVLSVTEKNLPVSASKLGGFHKMLMRIMDANGEGIVRTWTVRFQLSLLFPVTRAFSYGKGR